MTDYFKKLFAYENWANNAVLYSLVKADNPPQKALSLMSHIINAQTLWLCRIQNNKSSTGVWDEYSIEEISGMLNGSSTRWLEYISSISDSDLKKIISYKNTKGESFDSHLEDILTHLIIHSAYHRGQVILLMKSHVHVLPYIDYIQYVRNS